MSANEIANRISASFTLLTAALTADLRAAGSGFVEGSLVRLAAGQYIVDLEDSVTDPSVFPGPSAMLVSSVGQLAATAVTLDASIIVGATAGVFDRVQFTLRDNAGVQGDALVVISSIMMRFPTTD